MISFSKREVLVAPFVAALGLEAAERANASGAQDAALLATPGPFNSSVASRRGLRFGVSEHLGAGYCWSYPNHLYDQSSLPLAKGLVGFRDTAHLYGDFAHIEATA